MFCRPGRSSRPGRADLPGDDLLQPRRLDPAGLMSLSFRTLSGDARSQAHGGRPCAACGSGCSATGPISTMGIADYERRYMASYRDRGAASWWPLSTATRLVGAATGTPMDRPCRGFRGGLRRGGPSTFPMSSTAPKRPVARVSRAGRGTCLLRPARGARPRAWPALGRLLRGDPARGSPDAARAVSPARRVLARNAAMRRLRVCRPVSAGRISARRGNTKEAAAILDPGA
jgi:hypothetical protein